MSEQQRTASIAARKNQTIAALQRRIDELETANTELTQTVMKQELRLYRLTDLRVVN